MSRVLASITGLALAAVLAMPAAANAADRRADGARTHNARQMTDISSRRIHRRVIVRRGVVVRRGYWGPGAGYWGPRYAYPVYRRPFVGPYAWGYPYYRPWRPWYAAYPYYRPYPVVSVGFGFGPRWGWGGWGW